MRFRSGARWFGRGWFGDADTGLAALLAEDGNNFVRYFHPFLAHPTGELFGFELLKDFLERQFHQRMVTVRSIYEHAGG